MREFVLSKQGIQLVDVYSGPGAVCTGAARLAQEARDQAEALSQHLATQRRERELHQDRRSLLARIEALQTKLTDITEDLHQVTCQEQQRLDSSQRTQVQLAQARQADSLAPAPAKSHEKKPTH